MKKFKRYLIYILSAGVVVAALIALYRWQERSRQLSLGFPVLLPGAYVGTLEMALGDGKVNSTLYVERLREGTTLLFVAFVKDFQPQTIFPQRLTSTFSQTLERYRPVVIQWPGAILTLSGVEEKSGYQGMIRVGSDKVGNWTLRRMLPSEVSTVSLGENEEQILLWLRARERLRKAGVERDTIQTELNSTEERVKTLERALGDKNALQARSANRQKELETELTHLRENQEKSGRELESLSNSLDLLARITKRGQTVTLERRILQREARWYNVNWQGEEENQELSEEDTGIDQAKLELAVRRARETKSFLREREEEKKRIQQLTRELENPSALPEEEEENTQGVPKEEVPAERTPGEEKRQLWDQLFG